MFFDGIQSFYFSRVSSAYWVMIFLDDFLSQFGVFRNIVLSLIEQNIFIIESINRPIFEIISEICWCLS